MPFPIRVEGHTDNGGEVPEGKTLRLSLQRAASVVKGLHSHGVPESRLVAVGYGATQPIESNLTETGRARNRRVEIVMVAAQEQ